MDKETRILAINPGSTSTKIAVYQNGKTIFLKTIRHSVEELKAFPKVTDQYEYRKQIIYKELEDAGIQLDHIRAVIGRGGLVKPIASGVYEVNEALKTDLRNNLQGEHASNLGGLIADDIAHALPHAKAYIADPVVVDELCPLARYSGHPLFERISIFHALNQKAIARTYAKSINRNYEDLNLLVVHLGGGVTVGAHQKGKVIDVNQGLNGDGAFSPERSGTLPMNAVVEAAFSGKYTKDDMMKMLAGKGGISAYLGTNDAYQAELDAIAGDKKAHEVFEAMAYQVAKEVGAMSTVLKGDVDAILITGGIANSKWFCEMVMERIYKIAPIHIFPGEDEMRALAQNAEMVLSGEVEPKEYK